MTAIPVPLLVAVGGALGAVARFVVDGEVKARVPRWPLGTLVVNVAGSFVLGLLMGHLGSPGGPSRGASAFWTTGVCGGFTTFSTASVDAITLARTRSPGGARPATSALVYVIATLTLCVGAVWLGSAV